MVPPIVCNHDLIVHRESEQLTARFLICGPAYHCNISNRDTKDLVSVAELTIETIILINKDLTWSYFYGLF